ncbi:hypothetical protein [Comamonas sp. B-9]|uniref:hypothetical protein n=1 Tax=Comamonas sp. B-9 TaxID=1055192 RepID=UPI0011DCC97D|nr:hypothetical protein [Comamonas sp. B-9]
MTLSSQTCPLCGQTASFVITSKPHGKRFTCEQCTKFWIDDYSEDYLSAIPEMAVSEMKATLSGKARKTAEGHLYVIREPKPSEITGDGHGVARTSLVTEWVSVQGQS